METTHILDETETESVLKVLTDDSEIRSHFELEDKDSSTSDETETESVLDGDYLDTTFVL